MNELPLARRATRIAAGIAALLCLCGVAAAFDPAAGDLAKADANHIRVLTWNMENNFVSDAAATSGPITRVLQRVNPDIICFQEVSQSLAASTLQTTLQNILGGTWSVQRGESDGFDRNMLATRHGFVAGTLITDTVPASEVRGVTAGLVNLPDAVFGATNFYVMTVHMKSGGATGNGGDHQRRQTHADAIVNWMRDARTAGGSITLAAGTPMLVVGDTNLGFSGRGDEAPWHPTRTLLDGDIFFTGTYGADSPPDWDGTEATDAAPYNHANGDPDTQSSAFANPNSRFDRFIYTDSVIRVRGRFILNTGTLSGAALAFAPPTLQAGDTEDAADHLPVVVDFELGAEPPPGRILINEFSFDDASTDDRTFIELINVGGREVNLEAPLDYFVARSFNNLPTAPPGAHTEFERYDLVGVVPPGGLFVLYDSDAGGDSAAILGTITAALPPLQRMGTSSFVLNNGPDQAIALLTAAPTDVLVFADTLVEAFLYEDTVVASDRFFRTNNNVGAVIRLFAAQRSPFGGGVDTTLSRNVGSTLSNTFPVEWTIPDLATPAAPNNSALTSGRAGLLIK